ncbi:HAD family hydrolase [Desulfotalea psychrophila]|uniref:phosphoglycolate phosphatase n=1 Tax=Desulfotalea psychrophila (strain LSv54 / DSM 12343) TaxID=177439 RepID=Q6AQ39_DESPS|nr:HAD family hydrolase [Desulfotalea psychrophila]CAG35534.1 related to beta-phosphoglucomutase [Desulfotalea psychrophila LSv54]
MLKLVIFDCDGVMFDSKNLNKSYYNYLLDQLGHPPMDEDELNYVHAANVTNALKHIFRNYPEQSMQEIEGLRANTDYSSFLRHMNMEKDLPVFLETIKDRFHLAISTNRSETMETLLESYGLKKYFGKVMTAVNSKRPKPAADGMLEILEHFGCKPEEAIHIGDTTMDEQQAASAGVPLIAFRNKDLNANFHVDNFLDILELAPFKE